MSDSQGHGTATILGVGVDATRLDGTGKMSTAKPTSAGGALRYLQRRWAALFTSCFLGGLIGFGVSFLVEPSFTARTVIMPPQQQSGSISALSSQLGALSGLAGLGAVKSTAEQYVSLLSSRTIADQIIDQFKLMDLYDMKYRSDVRKKLTSGIVSVTANKKDGLITIDVEDHSPERAAQMAAAYVARLRDLTDGLAVNEARQRRIFFERELTSAKDRLTQAQVALQSSGIDAAALKTEPRTAADGYARLTAQLTAAQVKLQILQSSLTGNAPEIQAQQASISALKRELSRLEVPRETGKDGDYIGRYREYKYQETLFDIYVRQFELARLDESREGALIQVVDAALVPDKKSKPKRLYYGLVVAGLALAASATLLLRRRSRRTESEITD
jgi:capsule polysaccharide export protein KpsE/RkpR